MHPKDLQPSSFDEPVAGGAAAPWRSEAFVTQDVDEMIHHLNTQTHHRVSKLVPLQRGSSFSFTRVAVNLGRIELVQGRSTAIHMEGEPTCLTLSSMKPAVASSGIAMSSCRAIAAILLW